MGYYIPIYVYPGEAFVADALAAGVYGLIVVDLLLEADDELCLLGRAGLNFIPPGDADDGRQAAAGGAAEYVGLPVLCVDNRHYGRCRPRC